MNPQGGEMNFGDWLFTSDRLRTTDTKIVPCPADDGVLDVSADLRVQVRGLHLEDARPSLGVLRHLRPVDGEGEDVLLGVKA